MPIEIQEPFAAIVPDGAIIGIVGLKGSKKATLLKQIVEQHPSAKLMTAADQFHLPAGPILCIDRALDSQDALIKARSAAALEVMRRNGTTVFLSSHDETLLQRLADEIWWMNDGHLAAQGDPREVLGRYRGFIANRLSEAGRALAEPMNTTTRRGDGRAEVVSLETLDFAGAPNAILRSGEKAAIRVELKFHEAVEKPVIGIMIRTRVGFEVYGTNTQLEGVDLTAQEAGGTLQLSFHFSCELCPGDYTVTVACHDPDGTPHDWLDDAVAFSVADSRYTAGVANLHAAVQIL